MSESSQSSQPDASRLRASDHDRQLVADVLNAAFADGRITRDELDERLTSVWSARTFGDLTPITADLTGPVIRAQYATPQPVVAPAFRAPAPLVRMDPSASGHARKSMTAVLSSAKPGSGLILGNHLQVTAFMGEVHLDLREATFTTSSVRIDVTGIMSEIVVTVPDGVLVQDSTVKILAEGSIKGVVAPPPGAPVVSLHGAVVMGEVKVRGPEQRSVAQRLGITGR